MMEGTFVIEKGPDPESTALEGGISIDLSRLRPVPAEIIFTESSEVLLILKSAQEYL